MWQKLCQLALKRTENVGQNKVTLEFQGFSRMRQQNYPSLNKWKWKWSRSVMYDSATPWTVAYQASPSMGFSRQEYWGGLPFPSPGDLPNPGTEPGSPALQTDAWPSEPPGKSLWTSSVLQRKGRMVKRAVRRHSGIALPPQPLGASLFARWFLKVSLAQRLWARMLLPSVQGQDHPAELQKWDCHPETCSWRC